jgi:hypothetical protein
MINTYPPDEKTTYPHLFRTSTADNPKLTPNVVFCPSLRNPHYGMGEITIRLSTSVTPGADQQAVSSAACFSA